MSVYDLKSLKLPVLYGQSLKLFADVACNRLTQPLVLPTLLENGGIPRLRELKFDEEPTFFPLAIPLEHAHGPAKIPQMDAPARPQRPELPFRMIRDYAEAYASGQTTPLEVSERVIAAIAASDHTTPPMHAFVASQAEDIRRQAAESAERIRNGTARSILEGVPVAIKDEVDMQPYPTTVGTKFLGRQPAAADSTVAARLRAAGALLVGKTNMHEIGINPTGANVHHGRIANPYDLQHDTGGSSSGSGAAVAAGLVPVAIGADGGGSIRIPASLCGVVGLKPTFARVSEHGAAPLCWSVAHLGPLGASVEDVALTYLVVAGPDPAEPLTHQQPPVGITGWDTPNLNGVRIGVYPEWFHHASREMVEANEAMVAEFQKAGAILVEITIPELDAMRVAHAVTILSEMAACMENYPEHRNDFADSTRLSLVLGRVTTSHDYIQCQRMRTRALNIFEKVFHDCDVILSPGTALPVPLIPPAADANGWSDLGITTELMRFVFPANFTGHPAISFPVGYDTEGLPLSMHAMGRHWEEALLLRVAYNGEQHVQRRLPKHHWDLLAE